MKRLYILLSLCALMSTTSFAQDVTQKKKIKVYKTWISLNNSPHKIKGALYEIKDSSILVSNHRNPYATSRFETVNFPVNNIETIKIRKKNNVGSGVLAGAIGGLVVGGLIAGLLNDKDNPPCVGIGCDLASRLPASEGFTAVFLGVACGAGLGYALGSIKVKIPINGNIKNYNKHKDKLREYSIKK